MLYVLFCSYYTPILPVLVDLCDSFNYVFLNMSDITDKKLSCKLLGMYSTSFVSYVYGIGTWKTQACIMAPMTVKFEYLHINHIITTSQWHKSAARKLAPLLINDV